ncbi:DUF397 domain-containing protein [Streptomyces sp. NPDC059003]|uniref:DUF397 domain-containing protein n=1 Tax=Streptomyces sp. NPDC059003 TaxID=3346691 RepID=UPI00368E8C6A
MTLATGRAFSDWFKSSYSSEQGTECVEGQWFKSSYSDGGTPSCVEAYAAPDMLRVRYSKQNDEGGSVLAFSLTAWSAFAGHVGNVARPSA